MKLKDKPSVTLGLPNLGEWARRLFKPMAFRLRENQRSQPRLQLLDRISLAPRHSLALVKADGSLLLVATSAEGGPAFYPLIRSTDLVRPADLVRPDDLDRPLRTNARRAARVSW